MFKKAFNHIIPLLLAVVVFITSVGIEINMHYCKDTLSSFSFYAEANVCNPISEQSKDKHPQFTNCENTPEISERNCCSSETFFYQNDVVAKASITSENPTESFSATPPPSVYTTLLTVKGYQNKKSKNINSPPLPLKDFQSCFQIFRI